MTMVECKLKDKFWCVQVVNKNSHIGLEDISNDRRFTAYDLIEKGAKWIFENQFVSPGNWIVTCEEGSEVFTNEKFHKTYELVGPGINV